MNNKEFIAELSKKLGYTTKETTSLVSTFISELTEQLENEKQVSISGIGTFEVKKKDERVMVNPSTQQRMLIPPKLTVSFKPANTLKEKMQ